MERINKKLGYADRPHEWLSTCCHTFTWILAVCAAAAMRDRVILTLGTRLQTTNGYTSARLLAIVTPERS